jgi:hypothetical protein
MMKPIVKQYEQIKHEEEVEVYRETINNNDASPYTKQGGNNYNSYTPSYQQRSESVARPHINKYEFMNPVIQMEKTPSATSKTPSV